MRNKFSLLLLLIFVVIISGCVDKGDAPASSNALQITQESATSEQAAIQEPPKTCADNTPYNKCSSTKPKFCENGNLTDKSSVCGCPLKFTASGESCTKTKCSDGTIIDECSATKPKSCNMITSTAELIDAAAKCGCPSGYKLAGSACELLSSCPNLSPLINTKNVDKTHYTQTSIEAFNMPLLSLNNITEIEGYKIGGAISCFKDGTCGTLCRRGSQTGENINYYYCGGSIMLSKKIVNVDEKGNILENINMYKWATLVVYITFSDKNFTNDSGGKSFNATAITYIDTLCYDVTI